MIYSNLITGVRLTDLHHNLHLIGNGNKLANRCKEQCVVIYILFSNNVPKNMLNYIVYIACMHHLDYYTDYRIVIFAGQGLKLL